MSGALNAGTVKRLLPLTTNRSMHHAQTAPAHHYLLPEPPSSRRTAGPCVR